MGLICVNLAVDLPFLEDRSLIQVSMTGALLVLRRRAARRSRCWLSWCYFSRPSIFWLGLLDQLGDLLRLDPLDRPTSLFQLGLLCKFGHLSVKMVKFKLTKLVIYAIKYIIDHIIVDMVFYTNDNGCHNGVSTMLETLELSIPTVLCCLTAFMVSINVNQ
ncbi:hypothetical protein BATDEDRAFT_27940 [Batrachochytrium dendrobatidis JAM81]|uniref:Uncharacterized protein n=1 Tax=Batrachochytrium dendrobatidis (strain JAM81 / FGSC 10211) TaxID=684364 RepID=F4PCA8_BATDJ|nr:uncharacterized protein BATDEDRAFT_27940 [Batrachochytrium dendrobatidis JAM81]EGF77249.1 hypothetical protein BATDEDRAFT_27940 [Batrachochytrium dendrobatidis JAM81]|eukprot:XP_006682205.1 hypothetical protein BATDEDRAFT_27940 [Batrachochytrium dendrobatidis JAM81]